MKKIWKYEIKDIFARVMMPTCSTALDVQKQAGGLSLWALVDDDETLVERKIYIYGTGQPLPNHPGCYVGTYQDKEFVWHVFIEDEVVLGTGDIQNAAGEYVETPVRIVVD